MSNCADALCGVVEQDEWCARMRLYAGMCLYYALHVLCVCMNA